MLDIYRNYLLNIRNSLIQCGVNIPVESVDEYFDICKLQQELDDILYYYNILANSNSTDKLENFFIKFSVPLRKRIGDESYKEFLEFWEDYKKMSSSYAVYQSLCVKLQELNKELTSGGGYNVDSSVTTEDKQEKVSKENIKAEIDRQREDIFKMYYEPRVPEKEVKKEEIKKNRVSLFEDLFGDSSSSNESTKETSTDGNSNTEDSNTEEVSSGVNLDDVEEVSSGVNLDDAEEVSTGINLDDEEDTINDFSDDLSDEDAEEVSTGINLDDEEDTTNDFSDDLSDEDAENIFSGILQGVNSTEVDSKDVELVNHGNYLEDMIKEDEDDGVTYEDEDESSNWMSDEDEEDSDNWISDDESEEDEDNGITYEDEDESSNWMSDDEDEEYNEDEEEYDENDNVSYVDENDASWGISGDEEYEEDEDNGITYEDEEESSNWLSDDEDDEDEDDGVTYEDEDSSSWNMSDEDDYDEDDELPNIGEGNDEEVQSQSVNEILSTDESKKEPEKDILDTLQTETSKFVNRGYRTIKNLEKRLKGV